MTRGPSSRLSGVTGSRPSTTASASDPATRESGTRRTEPSPRKRKTMLPHGTAISGVHSFPGDTRIAPAPPAADRLNPLPGRSTRIAVPAPDAEQRAPPPAAETSLRAISTALPRRLPSGPHGQPSRARTERSKRRLVTATGWESGISDRVAHAGTNQLVIPTGVALLEVGQRQQVVVRRPSGCEVPPSATPGRPAGSRGPRRRHGRLRSSPRERAGGRHRRARSIAHGLRGAQLDEIILDHPPESVVEGLPRRADGKVTQGALGHPATGLLDEVVVQRLEEPCVAPVKLGRRDLAVVRDPEPRGVGPDEHDVAGSKLSRQARTKASYADLRLR